MKKEVVTIRLAQDTIEQIKKVAIEGNVSLWIRQTIEKELKENKNG